MNLRVGRQPRRHWGELCREPGCKAHRRNSAGYCEKHKPPTWITWNIMRQRVSNPNNPRYKARYQDRGITIDPRWDNYALFLADMGERPSLDHVIHRIDNNGPYTKSNCVWVTRSEHRGIHNRLGKWNTGHKGRNHHTKRREAEAAARAEHAA